MTRRRAASGVAVVLAAGRLTATYGTAGTTTRRPVVFTNPAP